MDRETLTVAVCGTNAPNLEQLAGIVAKAGHWGVVPIHWPNMVAWEAARGAHLYVVDSGALCVWNLANALSGTEPPSCERMKMCSRSSG